MYEEDRFSFGYCSKYVGQLHRPISIPADGAFYPVCQLSTTMIPPYETLGELFEYDHRKPVDLVVEAEETRDSIAIQTVKDYGAEHRAQHKALRAIAYLLFLEETGPFSAILYLHAGGMSKDQHLDEGVLLAQRGVVCLLIAGPLSSVRGSRPDPFYLPAVKEAYIRTGIDLQRGVDLPESMPQVDTTRMAYVGHNYDAT